MLFGGYLISFIVIVLFVNYLWHRRKYYILTWKMDSLLGLPFIGIALNVRSPQNLLNYISNIRECFKTRNALIWFGPQPIVYISEPKLMKKILNSANFLNKMYLYRNFTKHFGNGLISSSTPTWNHHRKLMNPFFTYKNLKQLMSVFNEETDILMNNLEKKLDTGPFDIIPFMHLCTLDISCRTTLGKRLHFQKSHNAKIIECLVSLLGLTVVQSSNPLYSFDFIYDRTKYGKMCTKYKSQLQEFVSELFQQNMSNDVKDNIQLSKDGEEIEKPKFFLESAVDFVKANEFSIQDVVDEAITVISGSDTTSNTLSYTIMCLAMFPEYQEKLFEELKAIFPDKNDMIVTADHLNNLEYSEMVVNENMRIMAPIPLVGRTAKEDYELDNGITLPKGSQIFLDIFNMQRDELNWGPQAKLFNPENFRKERQPEEYKNIFIPFANGIRPCVAGKYAVIVSKIVLAKVIRRYKVTTDFKFEDLHFVENVTLKLKRIPLVEFFEREC